MTVRILTGDCRELLPTLDAESVQCVVTSPPYWGLRDYGHAGQLGLEADPREYVAKLVSVFQEVRRVLRDDGTLWLNLGDCYATGGGKVGECPGGGEQGARWRGEGSKHDLPRARESTRGYRGDRLVNTNGGNIARPKTNGVGPMTQPNRMPIEGLKPKDLVGMPWRVAFALQEDGWYLRSDIIWSKPNPMPESVTDRPTKAHEYLFLLSKSERYYYDAAAIAEPAASAEEARWDPGTDGLSGADRNTGKSTRRFRRPFGWAAGPGDHSTLAHQQADAHPKTVDREEASVEGRLTRNRRTVWTVATQPFKGAHFATFPPALIEPCILAGSRPGDVVLDPFGGAGTTGLVADRLGRDALLIELNPDYAKLAHDRIHSDSPLFVEVANA